MSSFSPPQLADIGPDPCPEAVTALEKRLADYLPPDQVKLVRKAYEMGARAHEGQTRKSGEAYITHPVAVAGILADLRLDAETLCAAILHDALEDTPLPRSEIEAGFSPTVAELVDGVTKLDKLQFRDRQEAAAESFRKMMLAMARDLRVILIKLADRLHNMRTLDAMAVESRRRIARETLEIYAPIAQRLGMNKIKAELQDLGFRALYPFRHAVISRRIASQSRASTCRAWPRPWRSNCISQSRRWDASAGGVAVELKISARTHSWRNARSRAESPSAAVSAGATESARASACRTACCAALPGQRGTPAMKASAAARNAERSSSEAPCDTARW